MYARIDEITSFANIPTETRPVIQCEYAHAMGNSNGNYKVRGPWTAFVTLSSMRWEFEIVKWHIISAPLRS